MARDNLIYEIYERRLAGQLDPTSVPRHVGVILDGNRRWARSVGMGASQGHKRGADKISEFLSWAEDVGVRIVTLWLLSTDNLARDPAELAPLLKIIADAIDGLASSGRWNLRIVGATELLPDDVATRLAQAAASTDRPTTPGQDDTRVKVNIAVGYGGRQEIADAVRDLLRERAAAGQSLEEVAASLSEEDITAHLYTKGQPDPDLVIRTSGEQRLSGFLLWQSVHSEFYFCEVNWPAFRRIDFLRALRDYGQRDRRMGR
ncbi:Short-chain Z-isoprenyl diphosphate synthase [Actinomyces bovis]|uniref:Isoprenyl transferase n=1 Tax=Actinomyces bovis TaxID=1658 RepID=A0ABY1VM71_9ACTO|nr:isoprenyl transferase [Actinomyces bovis]SPT53170.1 Short-chain Z-isoprenyl diphosphate synthase [Actinomyces bovis]VEG52366.1 Short-chain Z-isoprenyl diphosphate synthase [Actinomyces israelii]